MESFLKSVVDPFIKRFLTVFERVWPLIKLAAHTRIAWFITVAGVGMVAQPFWEPIVVALVSKFFVVDIPEPGPGWGLVMVAMALIYHLVAIRAQGLRDAISAERVRAHDGLIVARFQSTHPPQQFTNLLYQVGDDHSYYLPDNHLAASATFLRDPVNHLLNPRLSGAAELLAETSNALSHFMAGHFHVHGNSTPPRLVMLPDLNVDRASRLPTTSQQQSYCEYARQLHTLIDEASAAHQAFIVETHQQLA